MCVFLPNKDCSAEQFQQRKPHTLLPVGYSATPIVVCCGNLVKVHYALNSLNSDKVLRPVAISFCLSTSGGVMRQFMFCSLHQSSVSQSFSDHLTLPLSRNSRSARPSKSLVSSNCSLIMPSLQIPLFTHSLSLLGRTVLVPRRECIIMSGSKWESFSFILYSTTNQLCCFVFKSGNSTSFRL